MMRASPGDNEINKPHSRGEALNGGAFRRANTPRHFGAKNKKAPQCHPSQEGNFSWSIIKSLAPGRVAGGRVISW